MSDHNGGPDCTAGGRTKDWIQGHRGQKLPLFDLRPEHVEVGDIAYSLAGTNRFTARARPRYNVAEHSVRVSHRCEELARESLSPDGGSWTDPEGVVQHAARWGLMHDAAEAFVGDMSRPLKHQPELAAYREIEKQIMAVIAEKFELGAEPPEVKVADDELLWTECRDLMQPLHPDWHTTAKSIRQPWRT